MNRTVGSSVDERGPVHVPEKVKLPDVRRPLVTGLEKAPRMGVGETAWLSEPALAQDGEWPEVDGARSHLQPEQEWRS